MFRGKCKAVYKKRQKTDDGLSELLKISKKRYILPSYDPKIFLSMFVNIVAHNSWASSRLETV